MYRRGLRARLEARPHTVAEIAREEQMRPREVEDELEHLFRSVRRAGGQVRVEPARCRKCGFIFSEETLGKPSRCPECRGTWITEARIGLVPAAPDAQLGD